MVARLTRALLVLWRSLRSGVVVWSTAVSKFISDTWVVDITINSFSYNFTRIHSSCWTLTMILGCLNITMLSCLFSSTLQGLRIRQPVQKDSFILSFFLAIRIFLVFNFYSFYRQKTMPAPSRQTKGMIFLISWFLLRFIAIFFFSSCCCTYATEANQKIGSAAYRRG